MDHAINNSVQTGLDALLENLAEIHHTETGPAEDLICSAHRCGMVTNFSAITYALKPGYLMLLEAGVSIVRLFGPEHGIVGVAGAGAHINSAPDMLSGLPTVSLYGKTRRPTPESMEDLDLVIFDLPDVGSRFYTYIWTLLHVMETCALTGVPIVVLDRPNPLGGVRIEGPGVDPDLQSFVGERSIPIVHGMTVGELSLLFADRFVPNVDVTLSPLIGWSREMTWKQTGLPWPCPSPNLPTPETVSVYPGTCLIEGTTLSAGRGTTLPFRMLGAPGIHPVHLADALEERTNHRWRPIYFTPSASKHAGEVCGGVAWYPPVDLETLQNMQPVRLGMEVLCTIRDLFPQVFHWHGEGAILHFDQLIGQSNVRICVDRGDSAQSIVSRWRDFESDFRRERELYLQY